MSVSSNFLWSILYTQSVCFVSGMVVPFSCINFINDMAKGFSDLSFVSFEDLKRIKVKKTQPIILECPVEGDPLVMWITAENKIKIVDEKNVFISGKEMIIKNSSYEHSGIYVCVTESYGRQSAFTFNVSVLGEFIHFFSFFERSLPPSPPNVIKN